jgi:hemerythrin-like domain-containing protein
MGEMTEAPRAVWAFAEHEHRDMRRGIERIHDVACEIQGWVAPELSTHLLGTLDWLDGVLEPHIAWEEGVLYPEIDARTGTPWATRLVRFDHQQIREMIRRIREDRTRLRGEDPSASLPELRCHLFSLEALLRSHIEREERFLIPIIGE